MRRNQVFFPISTARGREKVGFIEASLARRPMGGHQPLIMHLGRVGCDFAEKFQSVVGIDTLQLACTGGLNFRTRQRFLRGHYPDCDPALL